jgi:adenylylsulfate kinase
MKTSIECCERRDVKGLYKLAKEGKLANFTGISDPFEEPINADLVLDGDEQLSTIELNLEKIINHIKL